MDAFSITFFGAGGSSSSGAPNRQRYGSNTSCVLVEAGGQRVILDMGSGLLQLCIQIAKYSPESDSSNSHIHILLSHYHYDHIEGFPFLKLPKGCTATLWAEGRYNKSPKGLLYDYMNTPFFPVTPAIYDGKLDYKEIFEDESFLLSEDLKVDTMHLNHPGIVTGFKLHYKGKSFVYLLDHEHGGDGLEKLLDFCKGTDLMIYDASFTDEEYEEKYKGFGHSTYTEGISLAQAAGVKTLVFAHHATWRSDLELDAIAEASAMQFNGVCIMAREGLVIPI